MCCIRACGGYCCDGGAVRMPRAAGCPIRSATPARGWAELANLKSSDRRVLIVDDGHGELSALAGTAEPAMASSIDTVTALQVRGAAVQPLLNSELDLARSLGWSGSIAPPAAVASRPAGGPPTDTVQLQWLGEGAIRGALLDHIAAATDGDSI